MLQTVPMGCWWWQWLGAALLPLSSSSSLLSSSSSVPADVGYGEMSALVGKGLNVFISQLILSKSPLTPIAPSHSPPCFDAGTPAERPEDMEFQVSVQVREPQTPA